MFDRNTRVRSAAFVLVALQSVASYGYAQAHDIDELVASLNIDALNHFGRSERRRS